MDEYNGLLLDNVHPSEWRNPRPVGRYNLLVIGAGTAGLVAAAGAAALGAKVALVERALMGGDCLNFGCVPSKALLGSARAVANVRRAHEYGVHLPAPPEIAFADVMRRMRKLRANISPHDSAARFRELGVDVYLGHARFTDKDAVVVGEQALRFSRACIATGTRPAVPDIPGLVEVGYHTNETIFGLTELPRRLAIIGAGPIGCELAQAFARFGSEVSLIESEHGVLPREEPDAADIVRRRMIEEGVQVYCCGKELRAERSSGSEKRLRVESHDAQYELVVDEILVAAGRTPNTEQLGLDVAGIEWDASGVRVNDFLQTTNSRVYAAGDVCSRYKFTHAADALARIVIQNALFFGRRRASQLVIPWCTYTDPELAHVGLYPHEAETQGTVIDTLEVELASVDRAVLDGDTTGLLKVHLRRGTDKILGATLVAPRAGEMLSAITLAMTSGIGLKALGETLQPYPTQTEILKKAADAYQRRRLTPRVSRVLKQVLRWRR